MRRRSRSSAANERGRVLESAGDHAGAIAAYREAVELDPTNAHAWVNLALTHKLAHQWGDALRCGRRAADLEPDDYPTWWNLGISATALSRWDVARRAWRHCGIDVPTGDGPIAGLGLGQVPIRLNPHGDAEVVWCDRLDPARGQILNVPLPGSGHRWGDVVLHDGVPVGERVLGGHAIPVFDELERLVESDWPTLELHVDAPSAEDSADLERLFYEAAAAAQDWTRSVRHLCATCSTGSVPAHGDVQGWQPRRHVGLAARPADAKALLARWASGGEGRGFDDPVAVA